MAIIDKIQLSGTVYTIGQETTTAVTSASTDNEIPTAKAVYDAIPQGGGGKAISAGTNISVTTGETADTINCTLNARNGTGTNSFIHGSNQNLASGNQSHSEGYATQATGQGSHSEGYYSKAKANWSHSEGESTTANGISSHSEGRDTTTNAYGAHSEGYHTSANAEYSHTEGAYTVTNNKYEHSQGQYNVSNTGSTTFGDSGNTLFSVGNGTSNNARHNAFEIKQNGDIYLSSGGTDIKLQDYLGGGSITVDTALDSASTNPVENRVIYNKIDEVEQVTARALNELNDTFGGLKLVKLTQAEYNALATKDSSTLYIIVN